MTAPDAMAAETQEVDASTAPSRRGFPGRWQRSSWSAWRVSRTIISTSQPGAACARLPSQACVCAKRASCRNSGHAEWKENNI